MIDCRQPFVTKYDVLGSTVIHSEECQFHRNSFFGGIPKNRLYVHQTSFWKNTLKEFSHRE